MAPSFTNGGNLFVLPENEIDNNYYIFNEPSSINVWSLVP